MSQHDRKSAAPEEDFASESARRLQQVNKRLTLNLLIQGAAAHGFLTAHHLVREQLEQVRPGLTRLYDRFAICGMLNYFIGDIIPLYGFPSWFWSRTHHSGHPFYQHRLLANHGSQLTRASLRYLRERGRRKGVVSVPLLQQVQLYWLAMQLTRAERPYRKELTALAKGVVSVIWGIDEDRLDAEVTNAVAFGNLRTPKTLTGKFTQLAAIGYGGVERREGRFTVVAKSWYWPLIVHELIKGTAELVCLHGLSDLDDATYEYVMDQADQIEYETWMLQAGAELWRRLLAVLPRGRTPAHMLMQLARLDPGPLESLMLAVVGDAPQAQRRLQVLGGSAGSRAMASAWVTCQPPRVSVRFVNAEKPGANAHRHSVWALWNVCPPTVSPDNFAIHRTTEDNGSTN